MVPTGGRVTIKAKEKKRREKRKVLGEVMAEDGVAEGEGGAG